jgi:hypothetical protein
MYVCIYMASSSISLHYMYIYTTTWNEVIEYIILRILLALKKMLINKKKRYIYKRQRGRDEPMKTKINNREKCLNVIILKKK